MMGTDEHLSACVFRVGLLFARKSGPITNRLFRIGRRHSRHPYIIELSSSGVTSFCNSRHLVADC